jgi:hypothetical protein
LLVARLKEDPPNAVRADLQCNRCDDGDRHAPEYFDANDRWINPVEQARAQPDASNEA